MSTSPIQATTVVQDLAKAITSRYDADGDGRLSSDEFSGFLSSFLGSINSNPLSALGSSGLPTVSAAGATPSWPMRRTPPRSTRSGVFSSTTRTRPPG